jgi:hypothetical protein
LLEELAGGNAKECISLGRIAKVLIDMALAAGAGFVDALIRKPRNPNCAPQTLPGIIVAYIALLLPWVLVGALIGFLVSLIAA